MSCRGYGVMLWYWLVVFCVILTLACSLSACHMWVNRNHMFTDEIWAKPISLIFWNIEISLDFKNQKSVNSVNLSQISLLNMWLLIQIHFVHWAENDFLKNTSWVIWQGLGLYGEGGKFNSFLDSNRVRLKT